MGGHPVNGPFDRFVLFFLITADGSTVGIQFQVVSHATGEATVDPSGVFISAACCRPFRSFFKITEDTTWFPEYQAIIEQSANEMDQEARKELYHDAAAILLEQEQGLEFGAQLTVLEQSLTNLLSRADTPEAIDEALARTAARRFVIDAAIDAIDADDAVFAGDVSRLDLVRSRRAATASEYFERIAPAK